MNRKLIIITALIFAIVLTLCACTAKDGGEQSGSADTPPSTYTVTFDYGDGATITTLTVAEGEYVNLPDTPVRTDHSFDGWNCGAQAAEFPYKVTADVTFDACWTYVDPYFYTQPEASMIVSLGENAGPACEVKLQKGHYFTYQWYMNTTPDAAGATPVEGATDRVMSIPNGMETGSYYVFCRVTVRSFDTDKVTDTFDSDFSAIEVIRGATNVLVVGSGTVRQDGKHDSVNFLEKLLLAGGYDMSIDTITNGSNYNIWESGLTGDNQATVENKLKAKNYSYIILQMGRDYAVCTEATRDKELAAYKNILDMVAKYAPDCEVILIEGPWRQDMTTKYYVDRFIPAGIDTNDKHKDAIRKLFADYILPIRDDVSLCDMIEAFERAQAAGYNPYGHPTNDFPGIYGSYLLACMCYANITDQSPEGLSVTSCNYGSMKLSDASALQQIAAQVVLGK